MGLSRRCYLRVLVQPEVLLAAVVDQVAVGAPLRAGHLAEEAGPPILTAGAGPSGRRRFRLLDSVCGCHLPSSLYFGSLTVTAPTTTTMPTARVA